MCFEDKEAFEILLALNRFKPGEFGLHQILLPIFCEFSLLQSRLAGALV